MHDELPIMIVKMAMIYAFIMVLLFALNKAYTLWMEGRKLDAIAFTTCVTVCTGLALLVYHLLTTPLAPL